MHMWSVRTCKIWVTKKFPFKKHDRANLNLRSVPWYKLPWFLKLLLRRQFNALQR